MPEDYVNQPLLGTPTYPPSKSLSPPIRSYLRRFLFPTLFLALLLITAFGGVRYRAQKDGASIWGNDEYDSEYAEAGGSMSGMGGDGVEVWGTVSEEISKEDALLQNAVSEGEDGSTLPAMDEQLKEAMQNEDAWEPLGEDRNDGSPNKETSATVEKEKLESSDVDTLPICRRTMSYSFYGKHGFGSQFSIMLRVATIAKHFDYTLIIDSSDWNYGPWESYFLPLERNCRIEKTRPVRIPAGDQGHSKRPAWTKENHVYWYHDVDGLDAFFLALFVDSEALDQIHHEDRYGKVLETPLSPRETVPPVFHHAFSKLAETMREIWRVNEVIEEDNRELLRIMQPSSRGDEPREAGDLKIAVHARLGDKYRESYKIGPSHEDVKVPNRLSDDVGSSLGSSKIGSYVLASTRAVNAILYAERTDEAETEEEEETEWKGQPVLVIMSDSPVAWSEFKADPQTRSFDVVGTSHESHSTSERVVDPFSKTNGFHETAFNSLSLEQRIAVTRTFVRDVTVLAQHADAFVMTGSSNVGRLMALLMGEEKVVRQGRMTSLDSRWFPTARFA